MAQLIRDKTPAELKKINAEKLRLMRVEKAAAEMFLEHPQFSPSEKTFLVNALASMGVSNRQAFIQRAIVVQDEDMAYFMRRWSELLAAYHNRVQPLARLVRVGQAPFGQRADGVLVGVFSIDHLAWSAEIAGRHATNMRDIQNVPGITGGEIWIEGSISTDARKALEAENWVVHESVGQRLSN